MHFHIFANLKNQIRPHFSLSCIFFDNSGVNFARKCWHFLQIWGITFVCNKTARAVSRSRPMCAKKRKLQKVGNIFWKPDTAAGALGRASQPGEKVWTAESVFFLREKMRIHVARNVLSQWEFRCNLWLTVGFYLRSSWPRRAWRVWRPRRGKPPEEGPGLR